MASEPKPPQHSQCTDGLHLTNQPLTLPQNHTLHIVLDEHSPLQEATTQIPDLEGQADIVIHDSLPQDPIPPSTPGAQTQKSSQSSEPSQLIESSMPSSTNSSPLAIGDVNLTLAKVNVPGVSPSHYPLPTVLGVQTLKRSCSLDSTEPETKRPRDDRSLPLSSADGSVLDELNTTIVTINTPTDLVEPSTNPPTSERIRLIFLSHMPFSTFYSSRNKVSPAEETLMAAHKLKLPVFDYANVPIRYMEILGQGGEGLVVTAIIREKHYVIKTVCLPFISIDVIH